MTYLPIDLSTVDDLASLPPRELGPIVRQVATDIIIAAKTPPDRALLGRMIGEALEAHGRATTPMQRSRWAGQAIEQFADQVGELGAVSIEKVRRSMLTRHERMAVRLELTFNHLLPATPREFAGADSDELRQDIGVATKVAQTLVHQDTLRARLLHLDKLAPETVLHDPESREVILSMLEGRMGDFDAEQRARLAEMAASYQEDADTDALDTLRALHLVP